MVETVLKYIEDTRGKYKKSKNYTSFTSHTYPIYFKAINYATGHYQSIIPLT